MKDEALNVYERPKSEVMILVHESNFLQTTLEGPTEQNDGEIDITQP